MSTTAPDTTLTVAKLAASIKPWPSARRQSKEFAAKAIIANNVSNNVLAVIDLELPEWTQTIANPISTNGS
jgi:hypothetical protein